MADSSSRSLLQPRAESPRKKSAWIGKKSAYKTPLLIFFLLTLLAASIVISVIILLKSHKDRVKSWRVQPSVLLSIMTGLYALVLSGLFAFGVVVTWWRSIANGTTLNRLQNIYAGAIPTNFVPAFRVGREARRVALAALVVLIVDLAVGPLMQRSTKPRNLSITSRVPMDIHLAREIPDGYFGRGDRLSSRGINKVQGTILANGIATSEEDGYFCAGNGTCEGLVQAAGINFGCALVNETIDMLDPNSENATIFSLSLAMDYSRELPMLILNSQYLSDISENCTGTLTTDTCGIIPATVWYPIEISNRSLTLDYLSLVRNLSIVSNYTSAADARTDDPDAPMGPLKGIAEGLGLIFIGDASLDRNNNSIGYLSYYSQWPRLYQDTSFNFEDSPWPQSVIDNCPLRFNSPTDDILAAIFDYTFRAALGEAGREEQYKQSFSAVFRGTELRHFTDFKLLAITVGVMILGTAAALSLLWGCWQLDRFVTLSPLETGKAFGAPILMIAGPEQEADSIVKEIGHERVAHDGDELVWNGTVYATGRFESSGMSSTRSRMALSGDTDDGSFGTAEGGGSFRSHRRGMSSVSSIGSAGRSPSFEHSLGVSTKRWQDGDEEGDIAYRPRPRSKSGSEDRIPMLPITSPPGSSGYPQLPPIPRSGSLRVEPLLPSPRGGGGYRAEPLSPSPRGRRGSASAQGAAGKRPLSAIEEHNSSPEEPVPYF
ncbi:hypothetical protein CC78DRAFT_21635 [Lojkania enalia]|uniref:Uncharacterized protein n=1 Tax=Lojkania enalia TaxID=147567 RepID=A0A9P4KHP4_9PLEO|nr:hypothetical protein CC78DRAFT_21635 [Didymosphaeria enalia]